MTDSRTQILQRLRVALGQPSPLRPDDTPLPDADAIRSVLPAVAEDKESRIALFAERSEALKTAFHVIKDISEAQTKLQQIANDAQWTSVGIHPNPLVEQLSSALNLATVDFTKDVDPSELGQVPAGITTCRALVAQTGSILITDQDGGRTLSVLPEHHIVIATIDQLIADTPTAYAMLGDSTVPSFATFITGPSRTGDIERILVLGAHGPRQLTVLLIDPEA